MAQPSALEQYVLELVNRARADPAAEAARLGIDLNQGLASGTISTAAKAPLAMNALLVDAARAHSQWMIEADVFSHTGAGGSTPGNRMEAAGYRFGGTSAWGENIAMRTGALSPDVAALLHEQLVRSPGHRVNLMEDGFREIGLGLGNGDYQWPAPTGVRFSSFLTQNFARSGDAVFLTGVVFGDRDGDRFYDPGEGFGGVSLAIRNAATGAMSWAETWSAGGYQVALAAGSYEVTFSGGGLGAPVTRAVTIGGANVKVDLDASDRLTLVAVDATRAEGREGTTPFTFAVTRAGDLAETHWVNWWVTGSGARPADAADFAGGTLPWGWLEFRPGEATKTITVPVAGDTLREGDEEFTLRLGSPTAGLLVTQGTATGRILADEPSVWLHATDCWKPEGDGGSTAFRLTAIREGDVSGTDWVAWWATPSGGAAASAADFAGGAMPWGWLEFRPGERWKDITVQVAADLLREADEEFTVQLGNPSAGLAVTGTPAVARIFDDEPNLWVQPADAMRAEGQAGVTPFTFTVVRERGHAGTDWVAWWVEGTGANPADAADFASGTIPWGWVGFLPGETWKTVTVPVAGDRALEAEEDFIVRLGHASAGAAVVGNPAPGRILADESRVWLHGTDSWKAEGGSGTTRFTFTALRDGDADAEQWVSWWVEPTGPNPVDAADFAGNAMPWGWIGFMPGERWKTIALDIRGDTAFESDESFLLRLGSPTNGLAVTGGSAAGRILADDVLG